MPSQQIAFDAGLLRRYDRPGPRYTSYPTAPQFSADFGEAALREVARASNEDPIPRPLSLYVHVPFCFSPCFYCGCNRIITRDLARGRAYLDRLGHEIALVAPLFDRDREVIQLHFGGGTPNFLDAAQLCGVVETLRGAFRFADSDDRDISVELDPRFCNPADMPVLAAAGFNRTSLGVQDFDPKVQAAVNRIQSVEETRAIVDACRGAGMRSVNIDLIYGLPGQSLDGFRKTLDTVVAMRPDRLAVYSYAHLPHIFKPQTQIDDALLPDPDTKLALLQAAVEHLTAAGYVYIGMDHFALPDDELAVAQARGGLHRNFMGYTTHADSDLVGLGVSAISHIGGSFSQNPRDLPSWETALDAGRLPVFRGMRMDEDDEIRADLIQSLMCQGEVRVRAFQERHGIGFAEYFAADLQRLWPLADDGLVEVGPDAIRATPRGRLLLRNIAMCFDRYLDQTSVIDARPRFSRAI
ncbi:MAG TPA: oxygen-independent coproporphyrinogen III oxidase [Thermomonas sp.]|jgi:oxygen-independent coproporphyrinogen-3 oxidase|uniref:oxygen-independent coproporphyrinogen III oxidase n=1 Tax=Thermomonas sp. TaxID=1971895 RepID=UPI002B602CA1|nr:oxygen-independent coproporphyrinogen III oxidase [Thermomonas sp.]HOZ25030.1 oxygen-independent coproporphyrinogen III oxidase [Thermomonas sp.]HPW11688.1 oxygen-independent coproporphyrinogen III oxidase [Thermomonas sp.]